MNLVPLEVLPEAVGPGQQFEDVLPTFEAEQPPALLSREVATVQHVLPQFRDADAGAGVNPFRAHD